MDLRVGQMPEWRPLPYAAKETVADLLHVLPLAWKFGLEHAILHVRVDRDAHETDHQVDPGPRPGQPAGGQEQDSGLQDDKECDGAEPRDYA
jgi:hypothetical protein